MGLAIAVFVLAAVPTGMIVWNVAVLRRSPVRVERTVSVSVLIPARNEERNIGSALESVLANRNVPLEVYVLDDHSTDGTADVVRTIADRDARVRLVRGRRLPDRVWGKPFACMQLAEQASGEVLVFMDADVRLAPTALREIGAAVAGSDAAMVSGFPRQETESLAEKLVVPLMHFVLLGFLPIAQMRRSAQVSLGVACGQLCAVDRRAYEASGGHGAIADRIHDGVALARRLRECGYSTDLIDVNDLARCRMYRRGTDVVAGFAKNAHEGMGSRRGLLPWTAILFGGQVLPALLAFIVPWGSVAAALVYGGLAASLAGRWIVAARFGQSALGAALHPLGVAALVAIQWYALLRRTVGRPVTWKGRVVAGSGAPGAPVAASAHRRPRRSRA